MKKEPAIYILSTKSRGTLYVGVTTDIVKRVWQHKNNVITGFSKKYKIHNLVYYEMYEEIVSAISREKQIKKLERKYKIALIEASNPEWNDLWEKLI